MSEAERVGLLAGWWRALGLARTGTGAGARA
jgi:hypothetical protein